MQTLEKPQRLVSRKILLMKIGKNFSSNYEIDSDRRDESPRRDSPRRSSVGFDVVTSPRDSRPMRSMRPQTPPLRTAPRTPTRSRSRSRLSESSDYETSPSPSHYRTPEKTRKRSHSVETPPSHETSPYEMSPEKKHRRGMGGVRSPSGRSRGRSARRRL
ncbi:hypothetical protein HA402_001858 [Bradysia odoriphaga]|nr:hypothetical protein HA402_001858 [Bradysia odoriphaga]